MEDLDDLDNALFGRSVTDKDSKTSVGESKKKVMFKDSDENDPLKDLDFSDEDDFQETLKDKPAAKDSEVAHLFGIRSEERTEVKDSQIDGTTEKESSLLPSRNLKEKTQSQESILKESDFLGASTDTLLVSKSENLEERKPEKMKSMFDDDDDITSNLMEKSKSVPNTLAKKSSLMEDLFGSRPKSSPSIDVDRKKTPFNFDMPMSRSNTGESLTGMVSESHIPANTANTQSGFALSAQREPRRGRRASAVQNDPLGLLAASTLQIDEAPKVEKQIQSTAPEAASKSAAIENLPEWLGGPKVSKEQKQEIEKTRSDVSSSVKSAETSAKTSGLTDPLAIVPGIESADPSGLTSKLLGMEFDQQSTILNMQQQEHELRTAAALSQQSEKLNYLLEVQKVKLTEQEKQFNVLIARQLERQALIEAQMKSQQDRIDNYIQTLSAQPTTTPMMHLTMEKAMKMNSKESDDEKEESNGLVQKLQLEKLYLENTLDSLREKHEREISIIEDSYKKQIAFLEEAMVQMEKRMQDDVECLDADYKLKIQKLKEEISECESDHKREKETLKEEHSRFVEETRERHAKSLEILQKEHLETIERITKSKESERQAIEIMRIDGTNVQSILNKSQVIIEGLQDLQNKFESRDNNFTESHGNHLLNQEKNLDYLKESLQKQKEAFDEEKQKLMGTIQKLESNTTELTQEFRKQNTSFQESENILKSREQALLRDREIFVEQTNWERERLQAMRDAWAKEQDTQLGWLAQERQALAAEKGKLQIFSKLKIGVDESSKIELEATMKAAQDAAAAANQERLKWQEKLNELEVQKSALQEKESRLVQKAKELHEFTQEALAKREEGLEALKEAHFIEERYKAKISKMQMQEEILTQRESKLAAEKLELAKERLSFHVIEAEKPEKDMVSQVDSRTIHEARTDFSQLPSSTECTTYFKDIVDPHLVMLKWDLDGKGIFF